MPVTPQLTAWVGTLGLAVLGAALGAWWLARRLRAQWVSDMQHMLQAQFEAQARTQRLQLHDVSRSVDAPVHDAALVADPLNSQLAAAFEAQREALRQALQQTEDSVHQVLHRVPQAVQQAIRVELELQSRQQAAGDAARAAEQQRWQASQDERRAADLHVLLQALSAQPPARMPRTAESPLDPPLPPVPAPGTAARHPAAVSARPPELELTPLPRSQPSRDPEVGVPELSDEELDALPPALPEPGKARRRILPLPKKPPFHNL
jgi:hypothetical protein